jgi:geranylgeranyl transferase type-2 subunit beta
MTTLDQLDALLLTGAVNLGPGFRAQQLAYLRRSQLRDGGFPGRQGGSDLYYTDFALRLASLLEAGEALWERAAAYLRAAPEPSDLISVFGALNASRLLMGVDVLVPLDRDRLRQFLRSHALPSGGFAKTMGGPISAYATFVAALCAEMLDFPLPGPEATVSAVSALQGSRGGFRESAGSGAEQTNATAAAVAFLTMREALSPAAAADAAQFLGAMQGPGGGLWTHAEAPAEDLLSTFTGLVALAGLPDAEAFDLIGVARFVRDLARPEGGFAATRGDLEADLEYTYYGVGTLALLRAILPPAA